MEPVCKVAQEEPGDVVEALEEYRGLVTMEDENGVGAKGQAQGCEQGMVEEPRIRMPQRFVMVANYLWTVANLRKSPYKLAQRRLIESKEKRCSSSISPLRTRENLFAR